MVQVLLIFNKFQNKFELLKAHRRWSHIMNLIKITPPDHKLVAKVSIMLTVLTLLISIQFAFVTNVASASDGQDNIVVTPIQGNYSNAQVNITAYSSAGSVKAKTFWTLYYTWQCANTINYIQVDLDIVQEEFKTGGYIYTRWYSIADFGSLYPACKNNEPVYYITETVYYVISWDNGKNYHYNTVWERKLS
jgi:hypothetical protein